VRTLVCATSTNELNERLITSSVEVAPVYDTVGETTVLAAAEVALALIGLMVKKPVLPSQ
jgi:hypothetical protein